MEGEDLSGESLQFTAGGRSLLHVDVGQGGAGGCSAAGQIEIVAAEPTGLTGRARMGQDEKGQPYPSTDEVYAVKAVRSGEEDARGWSAGIFLTVHPMAIEPGTYPECDLAAAEYMQSPSTGWAVRVATPIPSGLTTQELAKESLETETMQLAWKIVTTAHAK